MKTLAEVLAESSALHRHLCPRQVLGVQMGLLAAGLLDLDLPQHDKRLLTIVETDGCFTTGLSMATNCWVGRRTMRVEDYGKVAATFVDTTCDTAIRVVPGSDGA
jgi:formylmethanofuran dehydrogenase subunit E